MTVVDQQNVDRVLNAVSDDGCPQVSARSEINSGKNRAVDNIFDHSGRALCEMSEAKEKTDENRGRKPGGCRSSENFGEAIEQITAPDHFFAERCENPRE